MGGEIYRRRLRAALATQTVETTSQCASSINAMNITGNVLWVVFCWLKIFWVNKMQKVLYYATNRSSIQFSVIRSRVALRARVTGVIPKQRKEGKGATVMSSLWGIGREVIYVRANINLSIIHPYLRSRIRAFMMYNYPGGRTYFCTWCGIHVCLHNKVVEKLRGGGKTGVTGE